MNFARDFCQSSNKGFDLEITAKVNYVRSRWLENLIVCLVIRIMHKYVEVFAFCSLA